MLKPNLRLVLKQVFRYRYKLFFLLRNVFRILMHPTHGLEFTKLPYLLILITNNLNLFNFLPCSSLFIHLRRAASSACNENVTGLTFFFTTFRSIGFFGRLKLNVSTSTN